MQCTCIFFHLLIYEFIFKYRFGYNDKNLKQSASIVASLIQTCKDPIWAVIGISALVSGLMGWIVVGYMGLIEGIAILITSVCIIVISTFADYLKDKQLIALKGAQLDENIACIRG